MGIFATPRTPAASTDGLRKGDLLGALCVFKVLEYEPQAMTKYGSSAAVRCEVTVVDGPHAGRVEPGFFAAGNLARQIGDALDVGTMAPGRVRQGGSPTGRTWWGVEWAVAEEDLARAERAVTGTAGPPPADAPF